MGIFFRNTLDINFLNVKIRCLGNVLHTVVNCYYCNNYLGEISHHGKGKKINQSFEFFAVFTNVADLRFLPMLHIWTDANIYNIGRNVRSVTFLETVKTSNGGVGISLRIRMWM